MQSSNNVLRIWRPIKTGISVSMTMVRRWADAFTLVMAMKPVKLIASIVSSLDKPIAHVRYQRYYYFSYNFYDLTYIT